MMRIGIRLMIRFVLRILILQLVLIIPSTYSFYFENVMKGHASSVYKVPACQKLPLCRKDKHNRWNLFQRHQSMTRSSSSSLSLLLDVPDDFFTITFPMLGILLSISKNFARIRMEERAWEQRLEDGREEYLRRNPYLTEIDMRKKEAAQEWSAYGVPRQIQEQQEKAARDEQQTDDRRRTRVSVIDKDYNNDEDNDYDEVRNDRNSKRIRKEDYCMTDEEIEMFELEFGVIYDPYYDDPYTIDELPPGKCEIDKLYGDRVYPNGEIFYKDAKTGLYYRQGSKPRNLSFFG